MKFKYILAILLGVILSGCVGVSSKGIFGTGVSVALDPRTVGTCHQKVFLVLEFQ